MPKARSSQISLSDTPYYHCVSRCVRRAFLCGEDRFTNKSYEHRRQWVEDRIHYLSQVFCIDVCAYAVMSNHTHIVLHVDSEKAKAMSTEEVISRWHKVFNGTLLTRDYLVDEKRSAMREAQLLTVYATVEVWRKRLSDISWFMRCLNEYIARQANKEDKCTGRFWEGRFKSQALLDEAALLACMAYVDLNPVRANMAKTPEASNHTSIQYRINAAKRKVQPKYLLPFVGNPRNNMPKGIPYSLIDYITLVDTTSRQIRDDKRGSVDDTQSPILTRLGISAEHWKELTTKFEACFSNAAGKLEYLERYCRNKEIYRIRSRATAKKSLN
ncbi:transposase [Alteromonas sp. KUL49]|uniref:transposase n=1 Tax=Alteromonas sp. KUL49 TaxID=2480798 RepID=UPI00102F0A65|nr:transposase [Alteromonas sp. KUL49]TAP39708.1 transposase [Alteromonas sp. KUL49]GEA11698.1 transposase [Alteromonas sp. KUL49]